MRSLLPGLSALAFSLGTPCAAAPAAPVAAPASAEAPTDVLGAKTLLDVGFAPTVDALEFTLRGDGPLGADLVHVAGEADDPEILTLAVRGVPSARRWMTLADPQIDRVLLHPARNEAKTSVLRVRMDGRFPVSAEMLAATTVREEAGHVVVRLPRNATVAARWAGAAKAAPAAVLPALMSAIVPALIPAGVVPPIGATASPGAPSVAVAAPPPPASATSTPGAGPSSVAGDNAPTLTVNPPTLAPPAVPAPEPVAAALVPTSLPGDGPVILANTPEPEGPGAGVAAMALLLIFGGGYVMWRKLRGANGAQGEAPLIRSLGTHVLGPKSGLLLLEVAGEMVLIGTSDKGVQMLTKIDRRQSRLETAASVAAFEPAAPAPAFEPAVAAGPSAPRRAPKLTVAERATAALSRMKTASEARRAEAAAAAQATTDDELTADGLERAFFARATDEGLLTEAVNEVEDRFEPRRPAAPQDLLRKIRQLQGA